MAWLPSDAFGNSFTRYGRQRCRCAREETTLKKTAALPFYEDVSALYFRGQPGGVSPYPRRLPAAPHARSPGVVERCPDTMCYAAALDNVEFGAEQKAIPD
jgi:hypothetical protein